MGLCQVWAAVWPVEEQDTAQAVCMAESHGNPNANCINCGGVAEDSRGLWQVNILGNPRYATWDLFDPPTNARAALEIWHSQGWRAWSTFKNGDYEAFLQGGPVATAQAAPGDAQDVMAGAAVASDPQANPSIVPWLIGGAATILVLLGGRR